MPKKEDEPKGPLEVTWQDQLAQAGEQSPADKEWKKVRKSDRKETRNSEIRDSVPV